MLERWMNFYLATSTAAATLIGLLFVVISVGADRRVGQATDVSKFLTPTFVFFGDVLLLSTLLTFPNHTALSVAVCLGGIGLGCIVYAVTLLTRFGRSYQGSELAAYVLLPIVAFGSLCVSGALAFVRNEHALTLAGFGIVALLVLAVRNSWAVVIDAATNRSRGT
jgi:hypothetical protein